MELLIDGACYKLWTPKDEAALEGIVKEHAKDIFGEDSIYFDIKQKIKSSAGIGSIPDGYVIKFGDTPRWYIVEVELTYHDPYRHILTQITNFINGVRNVSSQREIVAAIYERINEDEILKASIKQRLAAIEIHSFLSNLISNDPTVAIIIEEETEKLREVSKTLSRSIETKVVEFKTFEREGVGLAVHAHLFEPLWKPTAVKEPSHEVREGEKPLKVTLQDLLNRGLIEANQKIFMDYKDKTFEAEILSSDEIRLLDDGTTHRSLSAAAKQIRQTETNGWIWWYTYDENGRDCMMADLREKLRQQ